MKNGIKRVLVTGATGHIGYNICMAILESKIELIVLGRQKESYFLTGLFFALQIFSMEKTNREFASASGHGR